MKATILLAEDEQAMREVLTDYFTAKSGGDFKVVPAPDGDTALHLIETRRFDLLLLDIMLPGTDGFARAARHASRETRPFCSSRRARTNRTSCTATASVRTIMWSSRSRWRCCTPRRWRFCGGRGASMPGIH